MLGCSSCVMLSCLLTVALRCSVDCFRISQERPLYVGRVVPGSWSSVVSHSGMVKNRQELSAKLRLLDQLVMMENDVIEPKSKRSFPGNSTPLDRLSISVMETKQGSKKQRKVVELPRRRVIPPIDRIGISRLPSSRG